MCTINNLKSAQDATRHVQPVYRNQHQAYVFIFLLQFSSPPSHRPCIDHPPLPQTYPPSFNPSQKLESLDLSGVVKSGLISGSLSLAGDLLAQLLANQQAPSSTSSSSYDPIRAARMGTFGLFFYGPYQHYWYRALDRSFAAKTIPNFFAKVTLNQLCLAPLVIGTVFAWNLALQGQIKEYPEKVKRDFAPTLVAGWKFWVPAASLNFLVVPLKSQVLYMSTCGVIWTAILSSSSSKKAS